MFFCFTFCHHQREGANVLVIFISDEFVTHHHHHDHLIYCINPQNRLIPKWKRPFPSASLAPGTGTERNGKYNITRGRKHPTRQICKISVLRGMVSWKVWSVLMVFFPPGKSYVFLQNFEKAILEILMCSSTFCPSWKFYMYHFLLENLMCSYYIQVSWKI